MRKNKPSGLGGSGGDWSDTGTFVRKPASGWLHKEHELTNGSYVRYKLSVRFIIISTVSSTCFVVLRMCRDNRINESPSISSTNFSDAVIFYSLT